LGLLTTLKVRENFLKLKFFGNGLNPLSGAFGAGTEFILISLVVRIINRKKEYIVCFNNQLKRQ